MAKAEDKLNPNEQQEMLQRLRWQVDRGSTWIDNADTKAAVLLGLNGALIAGVIAADRKIIPSLLSTAGWARLLAAAYVVSVAWSCIWAVLSVLPNLGKPKSGGSLFHFLDVRDMSLGEFRVLSRKMTFWQEVEALEHQVHTLSTIAANKYIRLRFSIWGLLSGLVWGLVILFLRNFLV